MRYKYSLFIIIPIILIIIINYTFLQKTNRNINPVNINKTHSCASDSMILLDYKGPKAQILWKDNTRSFFCEVREAFYESTDKIKSKNIQAFFVQNFSNVEWGSYEGNWMLAEEAYYVIDSNMDGAMGITYVPFDNVITATTFLNIYGGKILNYKDIDKKILTDSSILLKDRIIF